MQPTGLFDVEEKPTVQGTQVHPAATVRSYSLAGDKHGLVAAFFRIIHQALALKQIIPEVCPLTPNEQEQDKFSWWIISLQAAMQQYSGSIQLDSIATCFLQDASERATVEALLETMPLSMRQAVFSTNVQCGSCHTASAPAPLLDLAINATVQSLLETMHRCSSCGAPLDQSTSFCGVFFPQAHTSPVPMQIMTPTHFVLLGLITKLDDYYFCLFVNSHIVEGQAANIMKDRYFLLYAPQDSPLRSRPNSRAAELTYLKYKKIQRYIHSPNTSPETEILGRPVCAFYCNVDSLRVDIRHNIQAIVTDETQTQMRSQPQSQPGMQEQNRVDALLFSADRRFEAIEPQPIRSIPVISMQDKHSFSTYNEESSDKSDHTNPPIIAYPTLSMPQIVEKGILNDIADAENGMYESTRRMYCVDCREHCIIYSILTVLLIIILILFMLVIRFYLKFENMTVTNLLVTRRAFLGFSDWNAPDIPNDQLAVNTTNTTNTTAPGTDMQNYSLVTTRTLSKWTIVNTLLGNRVFPTQGASNFTIQELHADKSELGSLAVQNLLFNQSFMADGAGTSDSLWFHGLTARNSTVGEIELTRNMTVNNDITTDIQDAAIAISNVITAGSVTQTNPLTITSPIAYYNSLSGPTVLSIPAGTLRLSNAATIQGMDKITGLFQFGGKFTVADVVSKNMVINKLNLGKMDPRSNITTKSLTAGSVILDTEGVRSSTKSFDLRTEATGNPSSAVQLVGELGQGTITVEQKTTAMGAVCGAQMKQESKESEKK